MDAKIACRNVWKLYGSNPEGFLAAHNGDPPDDAVGDEGYIPAVRHATLDVIPGEILVIMGLSESGKSTLVRCLSRLIEPTAGEVLFDGQDLMKIPPRDLIEFRRHNMAIVIYATIPTTRLTIFGLRTVPHEIVEAAITSGCTPRQVLWKVRMPLAFPAIMLGINQTIMYALFMVVIAAFIGTTDLGQEIFRSKAENDAGKSLVVGLCIAFMGLIADQLINSWARERKKVLGLA